MEADAQFDRGDAAIRSTLAQLAAEEGTSYESIDVLEPQPGTYVYALRGTLKTIALRAHEIRYAAEPETRRRFLDRRLRAVFKELWWEKSLVLMGIK